MLKSYLELYLSNSKGIHYRISPQIETIDLFFIVGRQIFPLFRGILSFRKKVFVGRSVVIRHKKIFEIGKSSRIGDYCLIDCLSQAGVKIGNGVSLGRFGKIRATASLQDVGYGVTIGNYVGIGEFFYLGAYGGIEIGDETIIGERFTVHSDNHNIDDTSSAIRTQGTLPLPVRIGRNCWIGSNVTVLGGVKIGDNCVIGAGTVVTKSVPDDNVVVGNPGRIIKSRKQLNSGIL